MSQPINPASVYKQGNAPDQTNPGLVPIPWTDDLWVDIVNHVVKRCVSMNPYVWVSIEGGGGGAFNAITSGVNVAAVMTVGTGATLNHSGSGVLDATAINGIPITGTLAHAGQIPISQPGNASAVWADPLVQGIQADGTTASTVNPVLISGKGADGNQHNILTDNTGLLSVGTHAVTLASTTITGNVTAVQPTGTNLHVVVDSAPSTAVTGTVTVQQATGTNLHAVLDAGAAVIGHVINDASAAVIGHVIADAGSTTAVTGNVTVVQPTGTSLHAVLDTTSTTAVTQATAANLNATVVGPTLTKGTQGAAGFSVQELHDAGRNTRIFMLDTITAAPLVEALATVVQWYGNAAVAGTTTPAVVPAGKILRLTSWKIQYQSLATVGYAVVRVRINTAGVVVLASPLAYSFEAGTNSGATTTAVTGAVTTASGDFPDGFEIPAAAGVGFTIAGYGPTGTLTLEGGVRFAVFGYEY